MTEPPRQRRLPTKTRSGIITLPSVAADVTDSDSCLPALTGLAQQLAIQQQQQAAVCSGRLLDDDDELEIARQQMARSGRVSQAPNDSTQVADDLTANLRRVEHRATGTPQDQACSAAQPPESASMARNQEAVQQAHDSLDAQQPSSPCGSAVNQQEVNVSHGEPSKPKPPVPKPGLPPLPAKTVVTGPLNSSTAPAVVSLPVKRRGSYKSLKKLAGSKDLALARKSTHWEKFGTILVLHCAADKKAEKDGGVLQVMMAEGYDTEVVDCQADALSSFNSKEVFPDMVLIDADHTYNTIQLLKQLQAQHPTVAIIVLGGPQARPGPVTALQAGASDYMRKPVDVEELMARIERHVQRQHCIKLEMESALEKVHAMVAKLAPASAIGEAVVQRPLAGDAVSRGGLNVVVETDFEEQMNELCEENAHLAARLAEAERRLELRTRLSRELTDPRLGLGSRGTSVEELRG